MRRYKLNPIMSQTKYDMILNRIKATRDCSYVKKSDFKIYRKTFHDVPEIL